MKRIKTYWLLLLVMIYTTTAVMAVGQTQARYVNTVSWDTVLGDAEEMVTSDLLQSVTGPDMTVLLGEMPQDTYQIPITLESGADIEGELTWEVQQPGYLSVEMSVDDTALLMDEPEAQGEEKGNLVQLEAGKPLTIVMRLIPEENVFTTPHPAEKVLVTVRWGDSLQGKFLVDFPAVEEAPEVTEPEVTEPEVTEPEVTEPEVTEPEVTEPEVTEPEVTEPEVTEPEVTEPEVTEPEETEPETTDPETTEPQATETDVAMAASEALENVEPEVTDGTANALAETDVASQESGDTEPVSDSAEVGESQTPSEVSETEPPEETTEAAGDSTEPTEPDNNEDGPASLEDNTEANESDADPEPEVTDEVTGTENGEAESNGQSGVAGGQQDVAVNNSQTETEGNGSNTGEEASSVPDDPIEIEVVADERFDADSRLTVQIVPPADVEMLQLGLGIEVSLIEGTEEAAEIAVGNFPPFLCYSYDDGDHYYMLYHAGLIELEASTEETLSLLLDFSRTEIESEELVIAVSGLQEELLVATGSAVVSVEPQEHAEISSCLLSDQQPIRVEIPKSWKAYTCEVVIEVLTCAWDEEDIVCEMVYSPVEPEEIGLILETEEDTGALILGIEDVLSPAGTYRISINWTYEGECIAEMQENFFINYLAYYKVAETGGAEQ